MQKIGFTVKCESEDEFRILYKEERCDAITLVREDQDYYQAFEEFVLTNKKNKLILVNFSSIGLQLTQMWPIFDYLKKESINLHFNEKPVAEDRQYLDLLEELASNEKQVASMRTHKGLRLAKSKGIVSGRPKVKSDVVEKIQYLHLYERKTIRQISLDCGVSLGTVHKYIKQSNRI